VPSALSGGPLSGYVQVNVAGLASLALNTSQMLRRTIEFVGLLTQNCTVTWGVALPDDQGLMWEVVNSTTGAFSVTCAGPVGAGYQVPQASSSGIMMTAGGFQPTELGAALRSDPLIISGITGVSPTVVLTAAQAAFTLIILQGNATGSPVLQCPNRVGLFAVANETAGNVTVKNAAGTGNTINSGLVAWCFNDSVNVANVA
jgi:hypothetical protein